MAATAGKNLRLRVSATAGGAGVYTVVAGITNAGLSHQGRNIDDIAAFGDTYVSRLQGLKDVTIDFSGNYEAADTNGQNAIRSALTNDTELWAQYLPSGAADGTGFKCRVVVERYDLGAAVEGKIGVTGSLAIHSGTLAVA
jgi:predicted secreted protein